jgi:hypothetical protein
MTLGSIPRAAELSPPLRACGVAGAGAGKLAGIAERRRRAWPLEVVRVAALAAFVALWFRGR